MPSVEPGQIVSVLLVAERLGMERLVMGVLELDALVKAGADVLVVDEAVADQLDLWPGGKRLEVGVEDALDVGAGLVVAMSACRQPMIQ